MYLARWERTAATLTLWVMGSRGWRCFVRRLFRGCSRYCSQTKVTPHPPQLLGPAVLHQEAHSHSYPYDWRTKLPVILRGSKQWFIRTNELKEGALKVTWTYLCLASLLVTQAVKNVRIQPESMIKGFLGTIERRPYWCISR